MLLRDTFMNIFYISKAKLSIPRIWRRQSTSMASNQLAAKPRPSQNGSKLHFFVIFFRATAELATAPAELNVKINF